MVTFHTHVKVVGVKSNELLHTEIKMENKTVHFFARYDKLMNKQKNSKKIGLTKQ